MWPFARVVNSPAPARETSYVPGRDPLPDGGKGRMPRRDCMGREQKNWLAVGAEAPGRNLGDQVVVD